ncbi:MAG: aminotransferase class V-fold PLP-dependent enzyme [Planctomycetes bacterium]|nr:aminotransferase class V-fold PLP-dependent enzyme [Planctomycetota bacterium]
MNEAKSFHMTAGEFRRVGKQVVDWVADYYENIESYPVLSQVAPGEVRGLLPAEAPRVGESFDKILSDLNEVILPGVTHWQSPNFFAFFPANASGPSILGDLVSSGLGVQGMLWATSPACTELETHVMDWLVDMMDLPAVFKSGNAGGGVIQDTASSSALCAVLAGRERATNFLSDKKGGDGRLVAYTSTQAHSSIEKAVRVAGLGSDNLRLVETDETFAMKPAALAAALNKDVAAGRLPCFVCATVGTTSSNGMDPLEEIGKICRQHNVWLHVDAAMSGTAGLCEEFRHFQQGLELADSYCFNPHKWMFTNFDCDCFYVADKGSLIRTLTVMPEYLRNKQTEAGAVIDYRDWHVPLGRRFRALKLWFVIRHYGVEGLQHHIRRHVKLAQDFAQWVKASENFELAVKPPLNLVCFRHVGGDEISKQIMDQLNQSGKIYLTHTVLNEQFTLRFSIGQTNTEARHVEQAWELLQQAAKEFE